MPDATSDIPKLPRTFFRREPVALAKSLLGQRLVRTLDDGTRLAGLIVETEAYLGIPDLAAHTARGRRTPRNESMWGDAGHAYVYFTYGMHHCFNVVAGKPDHPVAVLIRALEPTEGLDAMHARRATPRSRARRDTDLCSGPGKLCQALAITRDLDGVDLTKDSRLHLERVRHRRYPDSSIVTTTRVGVAYAGEWADKPLRFYVKGNPNISKA
ncbi:DNA-3-methyladenine glycosylase [Phycisphaerales bacterium AB-hyl4]|uniref:Putative 3-methyladenine DNA glycosylase n=1 Tax=Natronomicrosphaera hydrolytica TaxID=3242702 RepID=A0ABV4U6H3_9BACT